MNLYDAVVARKEKISVVGLGYVGLPRTVAFAKVADVIGFDISGKVEQYKGIDVTKEVELRPFKNNNFLNLGRKTSKGLQVSYCSCTYTY